MSDVEFLRAAAPRLRELADEDEFGSWNHLYRDLADLIDGMLKMHADVYADIDYDRAVCLTCCSESDLGEGLELPCPTLVALAIYVRSVLGETP